MEQTLTKIAKKDAQALKAAEGRAILAVAPHYWGRGDTGAEAIKALPSSGRKRGTKVVLFDVPAGTQVDGMGRMTYWPPEGEDWDTIREKFGQSPPEWANIQELGQTKL